SEKASLGTPFLLRAFSGETTLSRRLMRNMAPANCDVKLERPVTSECVCTGRFFVENIGPSGAVRADN
uniref:hypothetical protein n=1 Tax=Pseudomonas syringae TaxID=317 RepID=UPI0019684FB5